MRSMENMLTAIARNPLVAFQTKLAAEALLLRLQRQWGTANAFHSVFDEGLP